MDTPEIMSTLTTKKWVTIIMCGMAHIFKSPVRF